VENYTSTDMIISR